MSNSTTDHRPHESDALAVMRAHARRMRRLLDHHRDHLRTSGLTDATIEAASIYSITNPRQAARLLNWNGDGPVPAIAFPNTFIDGSVNQTYLRPDEPRLKDGKPVKYESERESTPRLYFASDELVDSTVWSDPTQPLIVVEGIKKALAAIQFGAIAISAQGITVWHNILHRRGHKNDFDSWRLHPDFNHVVLEGRVVFVAFDGGDTTVNPHVILAEARLARMLLAAKAEVRLFRIPSTDGGKVGLDDHLVTCEDPSAALAELQTEAIEADPFKRARALGATADSRLAGLELLDDLSFVAAYDVADEASQAILRDEVKKQAKLTTKAIEERVNAFRARFQPDPTDDNREDEGGRIIIDPEDPLSVARLFIAHRYQDGEQFTLRHHTGVFCAWDGTRYSITGEAEIRAALYAFLENTCQVVYKNGKRRLVRFKPHAKTVNPFLDAVKAVTNLPDRVSPPCWLGDGRKPAAEEILASENGLLHLPTGQFADHTPLFFSHNALEYAYDRAAPPPSMFLRFLEDLWPDDLEARSTLQEVFGYVLSQDTSHQKIVLVIGPKRSGKGTIGRLLKGLLGAHNVCNPTLSSLATNFGLAPLVGKQLATITDARLGGRIDQSAIVERLLSISGEDSITIDRKHMTALTTQLRTRFVVLTNELPRLADSSGALSSRFVVLTLKRSFFGREDRGLTGKLLAECPSILNWAIEGWARLRERGYFVQPHSSQDAAADLEELGSPVWVFTRDRCVVGAGHEVPCRALYQAWRSWCIDQGRDHPGTAASFGRDLRAAFPEITVRRPRDGDKRTRMYVGIDLRD